MQRPALVLLSLAASALALSACGSTPPSRFYTLEAVPAALQPDAVAGPLAVDVGPVVLAEGLDRAQMVTRVGPNEVELHEYSRWAEHLEDNVARVLAEDLSVALGTQRVGTLPGAETREDSWRVSVNVLRLESGADGQSLLVARWRLFKPGASTPALTRKSAFSTTLPTHDAGGMAAALSADLDALAKEIAAAFPAR
jgi:uncharacterized lipoprotein YmbA